MPINYEVHLYPRTQEEADRFQAKDNRSYLNYVHRSLMLSLHENLGFGTERMRTMSYNSYDIGEDALADNTVRPLITSVEDLLRGAEPEFGDPDFLETVSNTFWSLKKEMLEFGWDPEESLWPWKEPFGDDDFPKTWRKVTKREREKRASFLDYANKMSQICLTLMCVCAKELHITNGMGALRMDRAMRPVGERWRAFMRIYLTMDEDAVEKAKRELLREYNAMRMFTEERVL